MNMNSLKKAASGAIGKAKSVIKSTVNKGKAIVKKAEKKLASAIKGSTANTKKCINVKKSAENAAQKAIQIGKNVALNMAVKTGKTKSNAGKSASKRAEDAVKKVNSIVASAVRGSMVTATKTLAKSSGNSKLRNAVIGATGTTMCSDAIISNGKKQTNGKINVANLPVYNRARNYIEGQKVKVKGLDGKWYVGTVKADGYIGTGGARQFKFVPDNPKVYKRAMDVDYNYNLYKESVFERAQRSNKNPTAQQIQGKIAHDAPWPYKLKALKDYINTPNDWVEYNKKIYLLGTEQYGFDPEVNEQYAELYGDFMLGMLFENGMTCGIVGKRGMSGAVAGSGAGNIKKVSFDSAKIDEKTLKQLKKYNLDKKYQQALKNGFAARRQGTNGVISLTDNEIIKKNGYTYMYKLKVTKAGDHLRVYGRIDENGNLVFDYITKGN